MLMTQPEARFFLSALKPAHKVLEWGSGSSTAEIADIVESVVSIEHDKGWFDRVCRTIGQRKNVVQIFCAAKPPYNDRTDGDGTGMQFHDYISAPVRLGWKQYFDVVLIDGRARAECAHVCPIITRPDGLVFIHDFDLDDPARKSYAAAFESLVLVDKVETMAMFRPKPLSELIIRTT